jgi:aminocarboxymuconate-semialdehyde decarboxylase
VTIDFHAHLAPDEPQAPPFLRVLFDVDGYLERQQALGIELTVLSYGPSDLTGADGELDEAKRQHEFLADLVSRNPDRLAALAGVDPWGGAAWLAEAERALDSGFAGLCFPTSRQGSYLDGEEAADAFALAQERGVVVFLHPSDSPLGAGRTGDFALDNWIGRPCDTGICVSRLLLADTLSAYPDIRIVIAHGGGILPMLLGRLDWVHDGMKRRAAMTAGGGPPGGGPPGPPGSPHGHGPEDEPAGQPLEASLEGRPPSERIDQLYLDTAAYHPAAVRAALATVGPDRVVIGTDHPPVGDSPESALAVLDDLGLDEQDRRKIRSENARALLAGRDGVTPARPKEA